MINVCVNFILYICLLHYQLLYLYCFVFNYCCISNRPMGKEKILKSNQTKLFTGQTYAKVKQIQMCFSVFVQCLLHRMTKHTADHVLVQVRSLIPVDVTFHAIWTRRWLLNCRDNIKSSVLVGHRFWHRRGNSVSACAH